jgi:ubiquinone/menaquinone biosynthesis C-methylase UbiE
MPSKDHTKVVQREFTSQATIWAGAVPAHLRELVSGLNFRSGDSILDVAAGSCRVSRAIAPLVRQVTAVELTEAMLNKGREMAAIEGLTNITFKLGPAENLEFGDNSFDATITRYSFHHFVDPEPVIKEMVRVTKSNGRVIVIDILSPDQDDLAAKHNHYQRLRDPSHTCSPRLRELNAWFKKHNLKILERHSEDSINDLEGWLNLPSLADAVKDQIRQAVQEELSGGPPTGLQPFVEDSRVKFIEPVGWVVGQKVS